jgi:hypothetical protein
MKTYTIKDVCEMLGVYIRRCGYQKAAYWLDEETAERMKRDCPWGSGHYDRRRAAKALIAGCTVTLDLGYSGQLLADLSKQDHVHLAGVSDLADRLRS